MLFVYTLIIAILFSNVTEKLHVLPTTIYIYVVHTHVIQGVVDPTFITLGLDRVCVHSKGDVESKRSKASI